MRVKKSFCLANQADEGEGHLGEGPEIYENSTVILN